MKPLFDDRSLRTFNRYALPLVIAMSVSTAALPFLKATPNEAAQIDIVPFYDLYRIGEMFGLRSEGGEVTMKKVTREVLTPVPHTLNAVYADPTRAFVSVTDGASTTFVDYGRLYKERYRLIGITPDSAVFSAYGQRMTLKLGEPGNLSLKESVTAYVPDETAAPASSFVLARATVERYTENMGETWKNVSINEVVQKGKTVGFRVDRIAEGSPFALLGIQKGDVITGVDNKPIDSYAAAFAAYQSGLRRSAIKITVLRNNQPKDLEYEISR